MMRVFSNSTGRSRFRFVVSSTALDHKELRDLADEMVQLANASYEKTGSLQPFAMTLNEHAKISQLVSQIEVTARSIQETSRILENGLNLMARQGNLKAVGLCPAVRSETAGADLRQTTVFVEHRDGIAYQVTFSRAEPQEIVTVRAAPRFFVGLGRNRRLF
jgi:hypothetical protein